MKRAIHNDTLTGTKGYFLQDRMWVDKNIVEFVLAYWETTGKPTLPKCKTKRDAMLALRIYFKAYGNSMRVEHERTITDDAREEAARISKNFFPEFYSRSELSSRMP